MKRALATSVVLALASLALEARADQKTCFDAPVEGQQLRKAGKLHDAREKFLACAQKTCPTEIVDDCVKWASEVDAALPSVVVNARDAQGRDLDGATVSIDGGSFGPIGTRAIRLDPDKHRVTVRTAAGVEGSRDLTLREGEKERVVTLVFGARGILESTPPSPRAVPTYVWIVGGIGAVATLSFAVFGTLGLITRSSAHCDTGCFESDKSVVDTEFLVADVSLATGVVALGVAAVLYFTRPHAPVAIQASTRFVGIGGVF